MKKQLIKNVVVVAAAFSIGLTSFSPVPATLANAEYKIQVEEQITGQVLFFHGKELQIVDEAGKRFHVYLNYYTTKQIEEMNLSEGQLITIEGQFLTEEDLQSFELYQMYLPEGISEEDLDKIEVLYHEVKVLDQEQRYDESMLIWENIHKIIEPYYIAAWEPETFEDFIQYFDLEITAADLAKLESLYNESIALRKNLDVELADEKMSEFYEILHSYYQDTYTRPTFEDFMQGIEFDVTAEELVELERFYNEANQAEINEDWELASAMWNGFHMILQPYYLANYEPPTFEEFLSYHEFELTAEDIEKIKPLFEEIRGFEKSGDWENASERWGAIHEILQPYYDAMRPAFFRASQVIIDGKSF